MDLGLAVPVEQRVAEQPPPGEDPVVELQVVQDVAVVKDGAAPVAMAVWDEAGVLEQSVAGFAEVVGPGVGAGAALGVGSESIEVAGPKEFEKSTVPGLD